MDGSRKSGRVEGIIAIAQPVNADRPPQITLKMIRQSGERELTAQEIKLSVREAEQLAQFICSIARDAAPRRRRRRMKQ